MADQRTYKMLLGDIEAGGSGGLPDYSEANDGDVLEIENGEPAWVAPGGVWDAVIRLTHTNNSNDDSPANLTPSIVSGTHADLYNKLSNGEYPTVLVQYDHPWGYRIAVPMAYIIYFSDETISMIIAGYSPMAGLFQRFGGSSGLLLWGSDDTLSW